MVEHSEYDCVEEKYNLLISTYNSKNMGQGVVIKRFKFPDKQWQYISLGTIGEAIWEIACGK
jgi:hypothetical protein